MKNALVLSALLAVSGAAVAAPSRNLSQASTFKVSVTALRDAVAMAGACDARYSRAVMTAVKNTISKAKDVSDASARQQIANQESVKALETVADVEPSAACKSEAEHLTESGQALASRAGADEKFAEIQKQANSLFGM